MSGGEGELIDDLPWEFLLLEKLLHWEPAVLFQLPFVRLLQVPTEGVGAQLGLPYPLVRLVQADSEGGWGKKYRGARWWGQ